MFLLTSQTQVKPTRFRRAGSITGARAEPPERGSDLLERLLEIRDQVVGVLDAD
jgi:hypothetical protein